MGYNGNNRGRTHNWSGVGDKRHYNWGLNITAKAMVAPFVLLGELIEIASEIDTSSPKYTSSVKTKSVNHFPKTDARPHKLIKTLIEYYPEISQRIALLSKQNIELSSLRSKLRTVRRNIFLLGKRKRIINALNYRISKKEQFISTFHIFEEKIIGEPLDSKKLNGTVTAMFSDQAKCNSFHEGARLKKAIANLYKGISKIQSLSLKGADWQMIFYSKGLVFEDSGHILYVPYKDISIKETWMTHYASWDTHGYDIVSSSWMYTRLDGGPDMRYSSNNRIHYVQRYQMELKFDKIENGSSLFLIFQKKEDVSTMYKIISPQTKRDTESIKRVRQNGYRVF